MRIAICEDEPIFSDKLRVEIENYFNKHKEQTEICVYTDGIPLLRSYQNSEVFDLVFLDIQLIESDGMEIAAEIREIDDSVPIVFVTALLDRAIDGYSVSAFDYIVKADMDEKLPKVLNRFIEENQADTISIVTKENSTILLSYAEIMWVESDGRNTVVHTKKDCITIIESIGKFSEKLPSNRFVEVYKSIYVRIDEIKRVDADTLELSNCSVLPVSRRNRKKVLTAVMKNIQM